MANIVEVVVRTRDDEALAGMKATEAAFEESGKKSGEGFSAKFSEGLKGLGKGAGAFAGLSSALSIASPLGAAGLAVGSFAAVAVPELTKVQTALAATGKAGQKAWEQLTPGERALGTELKGLKASFGEVQQALAPVVATTATLAVGLAKDLMPALSVMATAGGKVIDDFLQPFDELVKSSFFEQFIKAMSQGAEQIGSVLGPALIGLIKVLMQLFIQLMPSGVQILKVLLPLIVQIATDVAPTIVVVADLVSGLLKWLSATHLLIPALAALSIAIALALDTNPIGLVLTAISLLITGIVEFAKHWSQIWAAVKRVVGEAINWIRGHWQLIVAILTGPLGPAVYLVTSRFGAIVGVVGRVVGAIRGAWSSVYNAIVSPVWSAVNAVFNFFNQIINFAASIPSRVLGFLGHIGGNIASFFGFAQGGEVGGAATGGPRSGLVMVGERGPELVRLPGGSHVYPASDTSRMVSQGGGPSHVVVSFDFGGAATDDFIKLLRKSIRIKGGNVQTVLGHA